MTVAELILRTLVHLIKSLLQNCTMMMSLRPSDFELFGDDIDMDRLQDPDMRIMYDKMRADVELEYYGTALEAWESYKKKMSTNYGTLLEKHLKDGIDEDEKAEFLYTVHEKARAKEVVKYLKYEIRELHEKKRRIECFDSEPELYKELILNMYSIIGDPNFDYMY